jgi:uncharacterized protein
VSQPWVVREGGVVVTVRLTPKSSRYEIAGVEHLSDGRAALKAGVRAVPEAGAANEALVRHWRQAACASNPARQAG